MIVGIVFLASCEPKNTGAPPNDTSAQEIDTIPKSSQTHLLFEKNITTYPSTADTAEFEIKELLGNSQLKLWGTKWGLGGEFKSIGDFFPRNVSDTDKGVLMWFTYDSVKINTHWQSNIILACEPWHRDYSDKYPKEPLLTTPDYIFTFAGRPSDFLLHNHRALRNRPTGRSMRNTETRRGIDIYNERVRRRLHSTGSTPFNNDHGAFFQNNVVGKDTVGLLTQFVNQKDARGMRYYFALDEGQDSNKIRIFLIATDSLGNNLLRAKTRTSATPLILQKSIPPGPNPFSK